MTYKKRVLQEFFPNAKLQRISSMQFNIILPNPPSVLGEAIILGTGRTSAMAWKDAWEKYA